MDKTDNPYKNQEEILREEKEEITQNVEKTCTLAYRDSL